MHAHFACHPLLAAGPSTYRLFTTLGNLLAYLFDFELAALLGFWIGTWRRKFPPTGLFLDYLVYSERVAQCSWAKGCSHSTLGMQNLKGWGLEVKTEGCFEVLLGGCLRRTMQTFVELQKGLLEQMAVLGGADGGLLGR